MREHTQSGRSASSPEGGEPFLFLYFSGLAGRPVLDAVSREHLGELDDLVIRATTPYPTVTGLRLRASRHPARLFPWSAVKALNARELFLEVRPDVPEPEWDYSARRDLMHRLAVEVSATTVVRIWDLHFVYSENRMALAHAETGLRGRLRALGLERLAVRLLGGLFKRGFRERLATFRHLQVLRKARDGSTPIPPRILEMHPADLSAVLRRLPSAWRRRVFGALPDEGAAAVLAECLPGLQRGLLRGTPRTRRQLLHRLLAAGPIGRPTL